MNQHVSDMRLYNLADFLETLPRNAIRMEGWLTDLKAGDEYDESSCTTIERLNGLAKLNSDQTKVSLKAAPVKEIQECGYAACAVGWACTMKENRRAGLKLVATSNAWDGRLDDDSMIGLQPTYKGEEGYEAVAKFFGIDVDVVDYLFGATAYSKYDPSPAKVARRIRKVVRRRAAGKQIIPDSYDY